MRRRLGTLAAIVAATLAVGAVAHGAEAPAREGYVAQVEPICQRDRQAGKRILRGVPNKIRNGRLRPAGRQLIRAAKRFGVMIRQIAAVPRPPADDARLRTWIKVLRIVRRRVARVGVHYRKGEKLEATHESIRAERSGNTANNVGIVFGFRECRLTRSRFR